ncbi:transcription factor IIA, alpha/beta subunit, partial [Syncephalis pseudoplumigaleata]
DEDAINSDLDDSDEDTVSGEGDEDTPNIILCQYEKVTRTKNKWKCVLKDGVMTMDGRDYVFHRANGDFEW